MTEAENLTVEILKQIREEIVKNGARIDHVRTELSARIDHVRIDLGERIDGVAARVAVVEGAVLEIAEQQRFVVLHLGALTERDRRLETEVDALRGRVDAIEERLGPR
ncbi:MAG: hypothetical protein AB7S26_38190 [Sandaracinaceae bacterium]